MTGQYVSVLGEFSHQQKNIGTTRWEPI